MGAGTHSMERMFKDMCCTPSKCGDNYSMLCKNEVPWYQGGEAALKLPDQNMDGDAHKLGGCWIIRRKNTGNRNAVLAAAIAGDGECADYTMVHHHQAKDLVSDVQRKRSSSRSWV